MCTFQLINFSDLFTTDKMNRQAEQSHSRWKSPLVIDGRFVQESWTSGIRDLWSSMGGEEEGDGEEVCPEGDPGVWIVGEGQASVLGGGGSSG